jgi:glycosyltransferase involved in cell wall biosynthesis
MLVGTPVVGARCGATAELIDEGRTGLLYPAGDDECLAQTLDRLASDATLSARLSEAARRSAKQAFSLARFRKRLVGLLRRATASQAR